MSSVSNSTTSKRSNGNKKKICAYCGKQESDQFARHSKN